MFKLSAEASLDGAITVENKFIVEYMPYADGDYVKVYLYALSLAARKQDKDDSVERLARRLDLDISTVDAAIEYWTEQGLMSRLGDEICFFSPRSARPKIKKFDIDKYGEFNRQAQNFITGRQITPNEYGEYYTLMEKFNLEWQAMALIVKYCVNLKGENVSCPYIVTVARNLAEDGYRTVDAVGERLDEYGVYYNDLCVVLGAMGGKRPDHEAVKLYKKWKIEFRFDKEVILHVAQNVKRGGAALLDAKLTQYRDLGLTSIAQIDEYEDARQKNYKLAKSVNKALGLYYENVDPEIATYINPWLGMGFEPNAILAAADYCMKKDMKRLSDLDAVIRDFFTLGLTTEAAVRERVGHENRYDGNIEKILKTLGTVGAVKDIHRAYFTNWSEKLDMPRDVIYHAATLAVGKDNPFAYMNSILRAWHDGGIRTVDGAKTTIAPSVASPAQPTGVVSEQRSAEELNALFTQITDDD
ncbi:MAG: DnaD domain protein [Clostridiales bacterium]|nr:DnaD domain protein [Clostridiales bacterium]